MMRQGFSALKLEGGKLVKIKLQYDERIRKIQILGDFFMHPEESIFDIEKALIGLKTNDRESMIREISKIKKMKNIEMIGITPEGIADAILEAAK